MLNWLNRQKSSTAASTAAYPRPTLADWRNREKKDIPRDTIPGTDRMARRNRKLKYLELFSIAVVISLIVGVDLYIFGINKRLSALESEFVDVKAWAFPASLLEGKYASLNARVRALTEAFSGLDARLTSISSQQQTPVIDVRTAGNETMTVPDAEAVPGTAGDEAMAVTEADIPSEAPAAGIAQAPAANAPESAETTGIVSRSDEQAPAAASAPVESQPAIAPVEPAGNAALAQDSGDEIPVEASAVEPAIPVTPATTASDTDLPQVSGKQGPWVINLLSDPSEALAKRFAARARDRGVPVEQNRTEVKGRVFWRIQITGFETASEARTRAEEVKEKLHLKDVWIFKQSG